MYSRCVREEVVDSSFFSELSRGMLQFSVSGCDMGLEGRGSLPHGT